MADFQLTFGGLTIGAGTVYPILRASGLAAAASYSAQRRGQW